MPRFYIGNLHYEATDPDLRDFFQPHKVTSVKIMLNRETGKPRGFAFVDIEGVTVEQIVTEFNRAEMMGRTLVVNEANAQEPRQKHNGQRSRER